MPEPRFTVDTSGGGSSVVQPVAVMAAMAATIAIGLALDANGTVLGVPRPPFVGGPGIKADPLLIVSVLLFAGAVWVAPRLPVRGFAWAALGLTLVLRLALAAGREGTGAWTEVFDLERSFEAKNEYLPALGALDYGPRWFVDHFAELVPSLPVHSAGHPPGLLLVLHGLGITTPAGMAALCIVAGALAVPLTYAVSRDRTATLLMAFSPVVLLFGVTSADALFATLALLPAWAFVRGRVLLGAAALAAVSFFAWSLLAVGAWAALWTWRRDGWRPAFVLAAVSGAALLAFYALLWLFTGFDPIGTFHSTESVYRLGVASIRPYAYWLFGSPTAFLFVLGLPIVWYAVRAEPAIWTVIVIAAVAGFTKAETERIWLLFAPFLCMAAAAVLPRERLPIVLGLLAAQAVLTELLWDTVW